MKYQVGDKVRVVPIEKFKKWEHRNSDGKMEKWAGKVMTVRNISGFDYQMKEDQDENYGYGWFWNDDVLEPVETMIPFDVYHLYKTRVRGMCVLLYRDGGWIFYDMDYVGCYCGLMNIADVDQNGKNKHGFSKYDIIAYKKYDSQSEAIGALLKDEEPSWDWEETAKTIMTIKEAEEKYGIRIVKEK